MGRMSGRQNTDNEPEDISVGLKSVVAMMTGVTAETGIVEFEGSTIRQSALYRRGLQ